MSAAFGRIKNALSRNWRGALIITVTFTVVYYIALLASMIYRFGNWPNYVTGYDWFGNVATIIKSTPSWTDMPPIIIEEWLLEVGYMNMSFGNGISEWSLNLIPAKMLVIVFLGLLIATIWALQKERVRECQRVDKSALMASGVGSGLVALTGATMTWVVCCATPSWIVGLAMLGMSVATANWLEPFGTWVALAGFAALAFAILSLAREPQSSEDRRSETQMPTSILPSGTSRSKPATL
ncbi:MAG: hypothetical protein RIC14_12920 [Filomicrobium sp.]